MSGGDERDDPPFEFGDVWPDDKPFPLSDAECARLVRGHPVRWRSTAGFRARFQPFPEGVGQPVRNLLIF